MSGTATKVSEKHVIARHTQGVVARRALEERDLIEVVIRHATPMANLKVAFSPHLPRCQSANARGDQCHRPASPENRRRYLEVVSGKKKWVEHANCWQHLKGGKPLLRAVRGGKK